MNKKVFATKEDLFKIISILKEAKIKFWLDGGWGVDVLNNKVSRDHRDIDINFDSNCLEQLLQMLTDLGYVIETDWRPVRIELYSDKYGYLDIHPFILNNDGTSKQADLNGGWYFFEKDYFDEVVFEGITIPCISVVGQLVFHSGYELRDKDKHDIKILKELRKEQVEIRKYNKEDERAYLECRLLAYLDSSYYNDVRREKEEFTSDSVTYLAWVKENGIEKVVGFIDIEFDSKDAMYNEEKCAIIWNLGVLPKYRRRGIANELWLNVRKDALNKGISYFELWTQEDPQANKFYQAIGFKQDEKATWIRCYTKDNNKDLVNYNKLNECYGVETLVFEAPLSKKEEFKKFCYRIDEVRLYRNKIV